MGEEIPIQHFRQSDFQAFGKRFRAEMELLESWFRTSALSEEGDVAGLELEAWLIDQQGRPAPENERFLAAVGSNQVVSELARFNFELNVHPQRMVGSGLSAMQAELESTWRMCQNRARELQLRAVLIGTLPTLTNDHLSLENLTPARRYAALNEQVLRLRHGRPLTLDITGPNTHLHEVHHDVMLEGASTSLQVHLQVPQSQAVRYYNAAMIASAISVGVATNASLLFGQVLWAESRIPVFEQAVDTGAASRRVGFGSDYVRESLWEVFQENDQVYPVLLPVELAGSPESLPHLRLHNGTIWRWNRPLVGFDADGKPHLRIEHRVMSAGPTLVDVMANATMALGLVHSLAAAPVAPESQLTFRQARENFYQAARVGWQAPIVWLSGGTKPLWKCVLEDALPAAAAGLERCGVDPAFAQRNLEIVRQRTERLSGGAVWQRAYLEQHPGELERLVRTYADLHDRDEPVHTWPVD